MLCCHVQVTPDGVAARVGKLRPGDRILSVSGELHVPLIRIDFKPSV